MARKKAAENLAQTRKSLAAAKNALEVALAEFYC